MAHVAPPPGLHGDTLPRPSSPQRSMASIASSSPDARHVRLIAASGQANENRVREILAEDPSWSSSQERDALRQSLQKVAARGNVPVTRLLLEKGADVEPRRELEYPALFKAAEAGHVGVVTQLLEHGANPNVRVRMRFHQTPLFVACFRGHNKVVELLLEHKADVNIRDKEGRTPLLYMVAERDRAKWTMETLVLLLGRGGADREARDNTGRTPLLWAATNGNQNTVEALLDNKKGGTVANVSATNNRGRTALHLAAEANLHAMVRLLLDHNADPNAISDGGWTALHNAAQNGHHDVVSLLLAQNANVNAELSNGMTPLHWAAFNGHEAVVAQLLKHDQTRTDLKDSFDRTPMLCAAAGFHNEIVRMLSPERTAYRLSEAARLACEECKATVVDFGSFKGNKKQLVSKPSVYDVLYGWEMDPDHPKGSGRPKVSTQVKDIKFKPDFRWIHLPANNIAWAEALLSKWFIEGKHTDVEHFKSLERCFYQEHRGPLAHANYMRTYCDRFPVFHDQESFSSSHDFTTVVEESSDLSSVPSTLTSNTLQGAGNVGVGPGAEAGPSSPRRPGVQEAGEGGSFLGSMRGDKEPGSKKKSKSEQLAERHPRRKARAHGPPGNPPGTKAQKMAARNNASSVVLDSSRLPELKGKIVLFMPYLHYETDERRQRMSQVIDFVRSGTGNPDGLGPVRDVMLAKGYLCSTPPLHPRRTLDQFFYRGIDTSIRDTDQVVYRYCQRHNLEKKVFMVDQLWLWILGKDLVVTCFPQRWDQPSNDPFNVVDGIIEETNAKTRTPLQSVYELAMLITSRCSGMFDRHRLSDQDYHFLDMFEGSIGLVTNTESELFNRFNKASEKSAQWLSQYTSSPRRRNISSLMSSPPSSFTLDSDKADEEEDGTQASTVEFSDALLDIGTETALLAEIKDIRDELNILNVLLTAQKATLLTFENKICDELGSADNTVGAFVSTKPMVAEIRKRSGDQLRLLETHCYDIERMDKQAESIYVSLTNLLDLKQKHSNALEARYARINAAFAARQGQTVLTFTIVTILFLPMSFIASFFSIQFKDLEDSLNVGYVSKYTFGIGLGISIPLIVMAFTARDIFHAAHGVYAAVQKSGYLLSLVSGKNKASQARRCERPDTSGGGGTATATAVVSCMMDHERDPIGSRSGIGSSHNPPNNQRYSYSHSRYDSVNNDGLDQLRRLSSNAPRQPPQYSSLPQHQMQSPPKWLLTAGNSTMRVRNNSAAPNTSSHGVARGDVGAAGGFTYIREHNYSIGSSVGALGRIGHGRPSNDLEKGVYA